MNKPEEVTIYADLEGCKVNGGSLPPEVALTARRPDLVIINKQTTPHQVILAELTMPFDRAANIEAAKTRKKARYEYLAADIRAGGYICINLPVEVGVRGYISPRNRESLFFLSHLCGVKRPKELLNKLRKTALLGSYQIYLARKSQEWIPGGLIKP